MTVYHKINRHCTDRKLLVEASVWSVTRFFLILFLDNLSHPSSTYHTVMSSRTLHNGVSLNLAANVDVEAPKVILGWSLGLLPGVTFKDRTGWKPDL